MRAISNVRGLEQFAPQLNPISGRSKVTVIWAVILRSIRPPPCYLEKLPTEFGVWGLKMFVGV